MECFEIYDEKGSGTGKKVSRKDAHQKGILHSGIFVWITDSRGVLLLQKRKKTKSFNPSKYDVSVGGHVSFGDTPIQTALRESEEELGLTMKENELELLGKIKVYVSVDLKNSDPPRKFIENQFIFMYHMEYKDLDLKKLKLQESELDGACIIHYKTFKSMIEKSDDRFVSFDANSEMMKLTFGFLDKKYEVLKQIPNSDDILEKIDLKKQIPTNKQNL